MTSITDYLLFERGHPLGHGSQRLYLFPCALGLVVENSKFVHNDSDFYVATVVKDVNKVAHNWREATEDDKLDVPLKVAVRSVHIQKTIEDFAEWALKRPAKKAKAPQPVLNQDDLIENQTKPEEAEAEGVKGDDTSKPLNTDASKKKGK